MNSSEEVMMAKHDEEPIIFGLIDNISSAQYGYTLKGQFVPGSNKILAHAFKPVTASTADKHTILKDKVKLHFIQSEFLFDDFILRSLIAEANSTFCALQTEKKRHGATSKLNYIKISATYRSILRSCIEKLQNDPEHAKYTEYITIFYSIETIWHLAEMLLLDSGGSSQLLAPQLIDWIRFHFPATEQMATDLLLLGNEASDSEKFWPTIEQLILQGQVETAIALLKFHPLSESPAFKMAKDILQAVPSLNVTEKYSKDKFQSQLQYWKTDAERKLTTNIFSVEPKLEQIIKLVTGNKDAWKDAIYQSKDWYEFMPAFIFYTNPICQPFQLSMYANDWLTSWLKTRNGGGGGSSDDDVDMKLVDYIIFNLMEHNSYKVLHGIQKIGDNQWFATHIIDLLYHANQLKKNAERETEELRQLRESLVFEYGSNLMSRNCLWEFGIDYLETCGKEGIHAVETLMTRFKPQNEKQALKLVSILRDRGLKKAEQEICKIQAKKSFVQRRYGNALEWAIRSRDSVCVAQIADHILIEFSKTGKMLCPDVIANLEHKMFISARLVFLIKYFEFYQSYRNRDFLIASERLINLIESKIIPEYFWPSVLIDCVPLLESKDIKITAKGTICIMQHVDTDLVRLVEKYKKQQLSKDSDKSIEILKDYRVENVGEIINLVRLACARNLSRALILENSAS